MSKYEQLKADMIAALKSGDKLRRITISDMIGTIDKMSTMGRTRIEITDTLVNETLTKYKKTVQEMVDTCPNDEKYANKKIEYLAKLAIAEEYAPKVIDDVEQIKQIIIDWGIMSNISIIAANKGIIMKQLMPYLKQKCCDMKVAQIALKNVIDAAE